MQGKAQNIFNSTVYVRQVVQHYIQPPLPPWMGRKLPEASDFKKPLLSFNTLLSQAFFLQVVK